MPLSKQVSVTCSDWYDREINMFKTSNYLLNVNYEPMCVRDGERLDLYKTLYKLIHLPTEKFLMWFHENPVQHMK
jgi:hypothetical protein